MTMAAPKSPKFRPKRPRAVRGASGRLPVAENKNSLEYGLGTEIANLFAGIGFRPDEGIKEWKGFAVKDPFDS
jgi:hypothetical protein